MYQLLPAVITAALLSGPVAVAPKQAASCAADLPARIIHFAKPDYPAIARLQGLSGTSLIRVDLSDTGTVSGAFVSISSGSSILDRAAIRTAQSMAYAPESRSCTAIAGSYAVEVEFAD
jgi:protein TonB